jgi:hypothetical protein
MVPSICAPIRPCDDSSSDPANVILTELKKMRIAHPLANDFSFGINCFKSTSLPPYLNFELENVCHSMEASSEKPLSPSFVMVSPSESTDCESFVEDEDEDEYEYGMFRERRMTVVRGPCL